MKQVCCSTLVALLLLVVQDSDGFTTCAPLTAAGILSTSTSCTCRKFRSRVPPRMMAIAGGDGGMPDDYGISASMRVFADISNNIANALNRLELPGISLPQLPKLELPPSIASPLLDSIPKPDVSVLFSSLPNVDLQGLIDTAGLDGEYPRQPAAQASTLLLEWLSRLQQLRIPGPDFALLLAEGSQALNDLIAVNPALAAPLAQLLSSLDHTATTVENLFAAGVTLVPEQYHAVVAIIVVGAASTALGMSIPDAAESAAKNGLPLPTSYDLPAIMGYYNGRPLTLLSRLSEVSYRLGSLAAKLWVDRKVGDGSAWERNMPGRAEEFVEFVQGAGPAFIKIGQGVSIRPDILPEPYLRELVKLQDRVRKIPPRGVVGWARRERGGGSGERDSLVVSLIGPG